MIHASSDYYVIAHVPYSRVALFRHVNGNLTRPMLLIYLLWFRCVFVGSVVSTCPSGGNLVDSSPPAASLLAFWLALFGGQRPLWIIVSVTSWNSFALRLCNVIVQVSNKLLGAPWLLAMGLRYGNHDPSFLFWRSICFMIFMDVPWFPGLFPAVSSKVPASCWVCLSDHCCWNNDFR